MTFWTGGHLCLRPAGHPTTGTTGGHYCAGPACPEPLFWPVSYVTAGLLERPNFDGHPVDVWGSDAGEHYRCGVQRDDLPWRELKGR